MDDLKWGSTRWRTMLGLMDEVAQHLTGRRTSVRPRRPYLRGVKAIMIPTPGNWAATAIIDIDPALSTADAYKAFLHEVGHIRHDYNPPAGESRTAGLPPDSVEPDWAKTATREYKADEDRADEQAARWARWAEQNLHRLDKSLGDPVLDRLAVLKKLEVYRRGSK